MTYTITLIPGDGTGPELTAAARRVLDATGVKINWEVHDAGVDVMDKFGTPLPEEVLESVRRNKVALKGPITTPIGTGFRSVNVALRHALDLYACVQEAGIEVEAINFLIPFLQAPDTENGVGHAANAARQLNVKLHYHKCEDDYLQMIGKPRHGYGKRMNPCLDCRIYTFKFAAQKMLEIGASFLVTGEVFDQRPNSQRLDALDITAKEAGLKDLVLRPLSAKLLRSTIPENQGWIDRTQLLDIKGRGRNQQIKLAAKFGIINYPAPAGGCLLTNEEYSLKVKDLLDHEGELTMHSANLLRLGRHLRLSPTAKIIIGKKQAENEAIKRAATPENILFELADFAGPVTMYIGAPEEHLINLAAMITASYGHIPADTEVKVNVTGGSNKKLLVKPLSREAIRKYFIYAV